MANEPELVQLVQWAKATHQAIALFEEAGQRVPKQFVRLKQAADEAVATQRVKLGLL